MLGCTLCVCKPSAVTMRSKGQALPVGRLGAAAAAGAASPNRQRAASRAAGSGSRKSLPEPLRRELASRSAAGQAHGVSSSWRACRRLPGSNSGRAGHHCIGPCDIDDRLTPASSAKGLYIQETKRKCTTGSAAHFAAFAQIRCPSLVLSARWRRQQAFSPACDTGMAPAACSFPLAASGALRCGSA